MRFLHLSTGRVRVADSTAIENIRVNGILNVSEALSSWHHGG